MAYITHADIEARLGPAAYVQLTDDEGTGSANPTRVEEARTGAEAEIDTYLARRHAVPIDVSGAAAVGGLLKRLALDLVEFRLHCRRPPAPADILRKRDQAVDLLRRLSQGEVLLPSVQEMPGNPGQGMGGRVLGHARLLTEAERASW